MATDLCPVSGVNRLIVAGSVDGICGAIACARVIEGEGGEIPRITFTQAFQVDRIKVSDWEADRHVGFIDIAVNNDLRSGGSELTETFLERVQKAGHQVIFIADEHGQEAWEAVLAKQELDKGQLTIKPRDRGDEYGSSCAILREALSEKVDAFGQELLDAGDQADRMNFNTRLGKIIHEATSSNLMSNQIREDIFQCFVKGQDPNDVVLGYQKEFEAIQENNQNILSQANDRGNGVIVCDGSVAQGKHNVTDLCRGVYAKKEASTNSDGSRCAVITHTPRGADSVCVIATNAKGVNLLDLLKGASVEGSGIPQRVTIKMEDVPRALEAL